MQLGAKMTHRTIHRREGPYKAARGKRSRSYPRDLRHRGPALERQKPIAFDFTSLYNPCRSTLRTLEISSSGPGEPESETEPPLLKR